MTLSAEPPLDLCPFEAMPLHLGLSLYLGRFFEMQGASQHLVFSFEIARRFSFILISPKSTTLIMSIQPRL